MVEEPGLRLKTGDLNVQGRAESGVQEPCPSQCAGGIPVWLLHQCSGAPHGREGAETAKGRQTT